MIEINITNNHIGNIVLLLLANPKFLNPPILLNIKLGLKLIKIKNINKNNNIVTERLYFLKKLLFIIYIYHLFLLINLSLINKKF